MRVIEDNGSTIEDNYEVFAIPRKIFGNAKEN